ncbi:hypothetical protein PV328_006331 [Microctonus aethiopoides]|uniref:RNA-polymerase II-associated protein 3-like C-terminal domain-containing protein n=1 Tax=Microctonus aethiopoides TaxID=144406 RepID=A0AA39FP66_9HYME|nr:hypothetical protein PV328_006331 [Microctonus aethiopoides]
MANEEFNLLTVKKPPEKRNLLEKYNIPVEHLSYEYITECKNIKELERIVLILRSGEEGFYPDLIRHAEEQLTSVNPGSIVLRKIQPTITRDMLGKDERQELDSDIDEWMKHMHLREKDLDDGKLLNQTEIIPQPDIRKITINSRQTSMNKTKTKRIKSCDYNAWDKYDVDTELNRIDLSEEQRQSQVKRNQQKQKEIFKKMSLTFTGTELSVMAEQEREKGNEAFKVGDYEEALQFYNSSLMIDSTINGYNNRAITYIKLHRFNDAVDDCNKVLAMDYTNVKALLRRALAFEQLEENKKALSDYETVLKIEPTNNLAIVAIKKLRIPCESKKVRIKIENDDNIQSSIEKIIDASYKKNDRKYEICFCDRAPTSSQYTKPLPHRKGNYCYDDSKISLNNNKKQSIFTHVEKSTRHSASSGVIIEELPNNEDVDIVAASNSKSKVIECEKNKEKIKFVRGDHAQDDFNGIINSPYEFILAWQSLRNDVDLKAHSQLLRTLGPDNLESVVGNKLDGQMFSKILHCLNQHFCNSNDAIMLRNFLMSLSQLKRFSIIKMFMDKNDEQALISMITFLNKEHVPQVEIICKAYNIKIT